ncbi:hypothetical protein AMTR_s00048p00121560 [Amborella trichopoda]|uniref:Uncharacterized protein n=1 Tax=Amborella trichopoda TaxID=13333 RepID=U5D006_AMBTC|nr:hypothetical protein AMTR_s00048p00121560 [Amborella trichopoda]
MWKHRKIEKLPENSRKGISGLGVKAPELRRASDSCGYAMTRPRYGPSEFTLSAVLYGGCDERREAEGPVRP